MQQHFKCQMCGCQFMAENDENVVCPSCQSNLVKRMTKRELGWPVLAAIFIAFALVGFGTSWLIKALFISEEEPDTEYPVFIDDSDDIVDTTTYVADVVTTDEQSTDLSNDVSIQSDASSSTSPATSSTASSSTTVTETTSPVLSKSEAQRILSTGEYDNIIPSSCKVTVNGTTMNYESFVNEVANGNYSNIRVSSISADAKRVVVTATEPKKSVSMDPTTTHNPTPSLTNADAQLILNSGVPDPRIPPTCVIVANGKSMSIQEFHRAVNEKKYSDVKVTNVSQDAKRITVTAKAPTESKTTSDTSTSSVLSKEDAQRILRSGRYDSRIPKGCVIVVNGMSMDYQSFYGAVDAKSISNIQVKDISADAKRITVSATVLFDE